MEKLLIALLVVIAGVVVLRKTICSLARTTKHRRISIPPRSRHPVLNTHKQRKNEHVRGTRPYYDDESDMLGHYSNNTRSFPDISHHTIDEYHGGGGKFGGGGASGNFASEHNHGTHVDTSSGYDSDSSGGGDSSDGGDSGGGGDD